MRFRLLVAALAGVACIAAASDPAERLPDPAQEAEARHIFRDVRCLVCQNESIDDSEADLARDPRQIVREQVKAGKHEAEIKRFLTDRYGEFVLLTPSFSIGNLALWGRPSSSWSAASRCCSCGCGSGRWTSNSRRWKRSACAAWTSTRHPDTIPPNIGREAAPRVT